MVERQRTILLSLRQITEEVRAQVSFENKISLLVERIRATTGADCCSLYLTDALGQYLRLAATDGLSQAAVGKATLKLGEGLVGYVGLKQELVDLADAPSHPNFKYLPEVGEDEYCSFLGVPVVNLGKLSGVLVVQSRERLRFGELEESFMVTLAAQVASIIANYRAESSENAVKRYRGEHGSGGIAIAKAVVWQAGVSLDDLQILYSDDPQLQQELFHQCIFQLQTEMDRAALEMEEKQKKQAAFGYMSGYGRLLDDTSFQDEVDNEIVRRNLTAPSAIKVVVQQRLEQVNREDEQDKYFDLRDFAQVLVSRLLNTEQLHQTHQDSPIVLVSRSFPAAIVAQLSKERIAGFVAVDSGVSSHTAVLARDLGIPSVIGVQLDLNTVDGHDIIVNGQTAEVLVDPAPSVALEYGQLESQSREQADLYSKERFEKGVTLDGSRIFIELNAGLSHDAVAELPQQTDGIGLYRTEIAFMLSEGFPLEQTQYEWYVKLLRQYSKLPVTMRTLDVGGDKDLSYLPIKEQNPALGWRGVRITLDQPQILKTQLHAMLRAHAECGNLQVMVPMVSRLEEAQAVRQIFDECFEELQQGLDRELAKPKFGLMLEVPSVVYLLEELAELCDFFSIGSNDLISYLLAVDRNNPKVTRFYDPFHPAVVRCLGYLNRKSRELGREIVVCGEMAGSPLGALLLLSLGYERLSMNYSEMGRVRYLVRRVSLPELREVGERAVQGGSCEQIRSLYLTYAHSQGLDRIIELAEQSAK